MTTTQTTGPDDQFSFWSTDVLIGICFRVTPQSEWPHWVVTSEAVEDYDKAQLREFAVEQLECQGVDIHAVNQMKS